MNNEEQYLHDFVNSILKGRIFIGRFQEKRYVSHLKDYRDVIVVNPDEKDLHIDLRVIKKRLSNTCKDKWIGITTPDTIGAPVGFCLWVELPEEVFGQYFYKVRSVRFRNNEVLLKIKPLRALVANTSMTKNNTTSETHSSKLEIFKQRLKHLILEDVSTFIYNTVTFNNIKETTKFLVLLLGTLLVGVIEGMKYLAEFSLKLLHELSFLMKTLTPFAIACVDMFGKVVGGFYILLAMIWRDSTKPRTHVNVISSQRNPMLTFGTKHHRLPLGR